MIDISKKSARIVAGTAILSITMGTVVMNALFWKSQSHDDLEKIVLMVSGVSMDVYKIVGLGFIASAFAARKWVKFFTSGILWMVCLAFGVTAAIGFNAMIKSKNQTTQMAENSKIEIVREDIDRKKKKLQVLEDELRSMKDNERYKSTAACSVPEERMRKDSRTFCTEFGTKKEDVATAAMIYEEAKKKHSTSQLVTKAADPQMAFFANLTGLKVEEVTEKWSLLVAISLEMVSAFGLFCISPSRRSNSRKNEDEAEESLEGRRAPGRPKGSRNKPKLEIVA